MTITNKFPGRCSKCSSTVAAGKGQAVNTGDGKWEVRCSAHSSGEATTAPRAGSTTSRSSHVTTCQYSGCRGQLDQYQIRHGHKFCSTDCRRDYQTGGRSGYFGGQWHQGDND